MYNNFDQRFLSPTVRHTPVKVAISPVSAFNISRNKKLPEDISNLDNFRFSGDESFPCRYAWLPKAYRALCINKFAFMDTEHAMVELGVGKNMVQSIRFWVQVADIAFPDQGGRYKISDFGKSVPGNLDPYLEDIRTLWLDPLENLNKYRKAPFCLVLSSLSLAH